MISSTEPQLLDFWGAMISIAGVDSPYLLAQPQGYILLPVVTLRINNNNVNNTFQPWYLGYPKAMREESYKLHYHIQAHAIDMLPIIICTPS